MKTYGLGIDLGTTISLASVVNHRGKPEVVCGASGRHLVPSAVYFDSHVDVGETAMEHGLRDPRGLAEAFKRDIGKPHFSREIRSTQVPPEVLTAYLLRYLMNNVRQAMGHVAPAVITVPAYFDERKRTATQQAAKLAGLDVLDIINEPTAAAIAIGHQMILGGETITRPRRLLVYDLGGGTFDVTLLEYSNKVFKAIATDGDIFLGGRDFDAKLINIIAKRFSDRHGIDPRQKLIEMQRLWKRAREIKHVLSDRERAVVNYAYEGMELDIEISRSEFEDAIEPLVERSMTTTADVLQSAGSTWKEVDDFLLVGGSSRIPLVAKKALEHFGRTPQMTSNPDELIAHGAALYAASKGEGILDANAQFDVVNVNAHSLGIRGTDVATKQRINKILIPRNTPLPTSRVYSFVTSRDGQKIAKISLLEGESENPDFCSVLGECLVRIDTPLPRGSALRVALNYTADGTITAVAKVAQLGTAAYVEIRRDGYATLDSLDKWTARLTSGGAKQSTEFLEHLDSRPSAQKLEDRDDKEKVAARLAELYRVIGLVSVDSTPPAGAVQSHRLAQLLSQEVETIKELIHSIELAHQQSEDFQDRLESAGQLAQLKMAWEHSMHLLSHCHLALGRECVADKLVDPRASMFVEEANELQSILEAP
jgi:molecular chaperone DnaK